MKLLLDKTELDFSSQPGIVGLGRLNYEARQGLYVHPTLMVTPEGQALGVIDAWTRKARGEDDIKESHRWIDGYGIMADREADIQELMEEARRRDYAVDYLIRAKHNRKLVGGQKL